MATLEKVMQMKQQGMSEMQIIDLLKQEGISPKEIYEAVSQSKIKSSIGYDGQPVNRMSPNTGALVQSMMQPEQQAEFSQEQSSPYSDNQGGMPQQQQMEYTPPAGGETAAPEAYQEYYPQYSQEYGGEYQPPQSMDVETINDIAEQIVEEKIEQIKKDSASFSSFKEEIKYSIDLLNQRLEKIENEIDSLKTAIIKKVGEYGEDIHSIEREMRMTQDSFSKILNPLTDNIRKLQTISGTGPEKTEESIRKVARAEPGFESYLR